MNIRKVLEYALQREYEGKAFFEIAYGLRKKEDNEQLGLIYSRINNPNLEVLENRLPRNGLGRVGTVQSGRG